MRSSADVLGLFSINVVSFSRNLVLRGLFASCVHVVGKGWSLRLHRAIEARSICCNSLAICFRHFKLQPGLSTLA